MRREKITVISFIGNVGGLLGLFLGFSFISIIEIFYMFSYPASSSKSRELGRKGRMVEDASKAQINNFFPSAFEINPFK